MNRLEKSIREENGATAYGDSQLNSSSPFTRFWNGTLYAFAIGEQVCYRSKDGDEFSTIEDRMLTQHGQPIYLVDGRYRPEGTLGKVKPAPNVC